MLDTRRKRASAIHVGCPWRGLLPEPSGDIDQDARQQAAFMYSGILAGAAVVFLVGPLLFPAGIAFFPGAAEAGAYRSGVQADDVYLHSTITSDVFQPGLVEAEINLPGAST